MNKSMLLFVAGVATIVNARECDLKKFSEGYISANRSDYEACVKAGHEDAVARAIAEAKVSVYEHTQYNRGFNDQENLLKVIKNPDKWRNSKLVNYQPLSEMRRESSLAELASVQGDIEKSNHHLTLAVNARVRAFDFPKPVMADFSLLLSTDHTVEEYKQFIESLDMNVVDLIRLRDGFVLYQNDLRAYNSSSDIEEGQKIEGAIAILNQKIEAMQAQAALENAEQEQTQENK